MQFLTLVLGLAFATALWSGVQAINAEARQSYDRAAASLGEGQFDLLLARDGGWINAARFVALRRAGWLVTPLVEGQITPDAGAPLRLLGIEPLTAPAGMAAAGVARTDLAGFLAGRVLLADPETARRLTPPPAVLQGRQVRAEAGLAPGTVLADIGAAQRLLGREGQVSRLLILPDQPQNQPALDQIAPDLLRQGAEAAPDPARLTGSFHLNLTAFGALSFIVGLFIVHGAVGLAMEQRRPLVRTLRALGAPLRLLVGLMLAELLAIALLAGGLGVLLGYVVAAALLPDVAATIRGLYGASVSGTLELRAVWWLSGLGMALAGTALAASGALWRIARMPPLASAGGRAWAVASARRTLGMAGAGLGLLALAAGIAAFGQGGGLWLGFTLLAALLLGGVLILPPFLALALTLAQRRRMGPVAEWFLADTRQQLPGLGLALMALMLAMAANVGVATMVSSFRLTFTGFLDQRLSAALYVNAEPAGDLRALEAFLEAEARELLPILVTEASVAGWPAQIYGVRGGPTYRQNWHFLAGGAEAWDTLVAGRAVIVNEQLARRADLAPGDALTVLPGLVLPVAAVVGDYGNPVGQVILGEDLFRATFPEAAPRRFAVQADDPDTLRRALLRDHGLPTAAITDQAEQKALALAIFERTFAVTGALNVLTLAVAGFAMLMSLLTLAALRLPQLAPVWALGLTQRHLAGLELLRAGLLAAMTALLALPLGLGLAWALLSVVNVEAFGWRLPMFLFPADYARLGLAAMVAAGLAALWPAWRLARRPPAELLKVFANER
nr:FtsX-like permease family protein [Szabonella alba]